MTAARMGISRDLHRVILDDGVGEQLLAGLAKRASAAGAVVGVDLDVEHLAWRTVVTPSTTSDLSAPSIALPCGSRTPLFSVTMTRAFTDGLATSQAAFEAAPWSEARDRRRVAGRAQLGGGRGVAAAERAIDQPAP